MLDSITFGLTAFDRPRHLETSVRSILKRYPSADILVADNGRLRSRLPDGVRVVRLPYDSGLSRCRNALIDNLTRDYLMLLDDDFVFTPETRVERLLNVLAADDEVGCAGGAVVGVSGRASTYAMDIEVFRGTMHVREVSHRRRVTPSGIAYLLCDMVWNFALFRREMLQQHRWDGRLKVGEHAPYFHDVKRSGRWRVACVPTVSCYHAAAGRSDDYQRHRHRAKDFFADYARRNGLLGLKREEGEEFVSDQFETRPSVVVLGAGHSGTTVLTRMLHAAGWSAGDADRRFAESRRVRMLNNFISQRGRLPASFAEEAVFRLPQPFALKDPRFVRTLHHWLPTFDRLLRPPVLVRLTRDLVATAASYRRRGYKGDAVAHVSALNEAADRQYANWPWGRMAVDYSQLGAAAALFDPQVFAEQRQRGSDQLAGGELFEATDRRDRRTAPSAAADADSAAVDYDAKDSAAFGHFSDSEPVEPHYAADASAPPATEAWPDSAERWPEGNWFAGSGTDGRAVDSSVAHDAADGDSAAAPGGESGTPRRNRSLGQFRDDLWGA